MNTQTHMLRVGTRIPAEQVMEVYVNGSLEHRLIERMDGTSYVRHPVLNPGEQAFHTLDGRCYIASATKAA